MSRESKGRKDMESRETDSPRKRLCCKPTTHRIIINTACNAFLNLKHPVLSSITMVTTSSLAHNSQHLEYLSTPIQLGRFSRLVRYQIACLSSEPATEPANLSAMPCSSALPEGAAPYDTAIIIALIMSLTRGISIKYSSHYCLDRTLP